MVTHYGNILGEDNLGVPWTINKGWSLLTYSESTYTNKYILSLTVVPGFLLEVSCRSFFSPGSQRFVFLYLKRLLDLLRPLLKTDSTRRSTLVSDQLKD